MIPEEERDARVFNMGSRFAELIWLWMKSSGPTRRVPLGFRRSGSETKRYRFQTRSV
jgi:hypothetical protein